MKSLGLRHLALRVRDAQKSKKFYCDFFGMSVEWEPDAKNTFLTSQGQDNLALHETEDLVIDEKNQALDHLGFVMATPEDVDELYEKALKDKIPIHQHIKKHRDGAYSFYLKDPDDYVVQIIHHPPLSNAALK
jgi:catechol 2,3-dioxygenase-like lactoylglutathione lyase family enzyme